MQTVIIFSPIWSPQGNQAYKYLIWRLSRNVTRALQGEARRTFIQLPASKGRSSHPRYSQRLHNINSPSSGAVESIERSALCRSLKFRLTISHSLLQDFELTASLRGISGT